MTRYDLTGAAGLAAFLRIHQSVLQLAMPKLQQSGHDFQQLPKLIAADLTALDSSTAQHFGDVACDLAGDGLGYAYVIAGSHLGSKILNRRRLRSQDANVLRAGHYLVRDEAERVWRSVTARLQSMTARGAEQDRIVAGALACFQCFETVAMTGKPEA